MAGVFYSSPFNSTFFTSCCQLAICDDQQKCPGCKTDVYPFYTDMPDQERDDMSRGYCYHKVGRSRSDQARKNSR